MDSLAPDRRSPQLRERLVDVVQEGLERGDITGQSAQALEELLHEPAPETARPLARPLTTRERQILELLASGATGEQIAEQLALSPETVQKHVHNAKRKMGADTRAHMIALAVEHGLLRRG